jgi:hypothetical protein
MEDDMLAGWYEKGGLAEKVIEVGDMEIPRARPGEVLVRLRASSVSPSDYKKRPAKASLEFPRIVPYSDGAGVVEALGAGVSDFKLSDRVRTFNAQFKRAIQRSGRHASTGDDPRTLPVMTGSIDRRSRNDGMVVSALRARAPTATASLGRELLREEIDGTMTKSRPLCHGTVEDHRRVNRCCRKSPF